MKNILSIAPLAILFCVAAFFAHKNYFIQDDAYIAFVYAKNFANGHGLVWYPGSDEYGYTSFLYTLTVGIFMAVLRGVDPEYISAAINFTAYIAALALTYLLTLRLSGAKLAGTCAVLALATHHTFSAYASGGLETMVVTALVMGFYYQLFTKHEAHNRKHHLQLGLLAAAALLTRLDSAILLFPGYVYLLFRHCEEAKPTRQSSLARVAALATTKNLWIAAAIPALGVIALLAWAYSYYGYALPNTFYAKIPGDQSMAWLGRRYILKYLELHHYIPVYLGSFALLIMAYIAIIKKHWRDTVPLLCLTAAIALWLGYVIYVGGDFMEFRLFVPVLPMFVVGVFAAAQMTYAGKHTTSALCMICLCILVAGNHSQSRAVAKTHMFLDTPTFVETTKGLDRWITEPEMGWRHIGIALGKLFPDTSENNAIIAASAAGAITYYSGLPVIDLFGLNSRDAAAYSRRFDYRPGKHRAPPPPRPGHAFIATDEFLTLEQVNLNIFHPRLLCKKQSRYLFQDRRVYVFPFAQHRTLLLPVGPSCHLIADYIAPHPRIEELLAAGTILDYRTHQQQFPCPGWLCLK